MLLFTWYDYLVFIAGLYYIIRIPVKNYYTSVPARVRYLYAIKKNGFRKLLVARSANFLSFLIIGVYTISKGNFHLLWSVLVIGFTLFAVTGLITGLFLADKINANVANAIQKYESGEGRPEKTPKAGALSIVFLILWLTTWIKF